ncbi:arginine N-succinyltransferase [Oligoflexia bacterium]|nr:arginine N-succinyltransferase [Oligoflexia bacterium]
MENEEQQEETTSRRFGCLQVLIIVLVVALCTALGTAWWVKHYLYASNFKPTKLTTQEEQTLEGKLSRLGAPDPENPSGLKPEQYTEEGAKREIILTERELNALVAREPELAEHVAIDLAKDLLSLKIIVPLDEDILIIGGKTLRIKCGVKLGYKNDKPVVALQGVSLGGIPLPNAWLGDMKYKNLVEEFGEKGSFWDFVSRGVENITVGPDHIRIKLRE